MKTILLSLFVLVCGKFHSAYSLGIEVSAHPSDTLEMWVTFNGSEMQVKARYSLRVTSEGMSNTHFILNPGFQGVKISSPQLASYQMGMKPERPFPFYSLTFKQALEKGTIEPIVFEYTVNLEQFNHIQSNWLELSVDKMWFPNHHDLDNKFTSIIHLRNFYQGYTLITYTDSKVTSFGADSLRIESRKARPEVLILAGKDMQAKTYTFPHGRVELVASQSLAEEHTQGIVDRAQKIMGHYNGSIGQANPLLHLRIVVRNCPLEEIGYQFQREGTVVMAKEDNSFAGLAHEISHYWWSSHNFITEPWLNESFANYSMYLALEQLDKVSYQKMSAQFEESSKNLPPVMGTTLFSHEKSFDVYYMKGTTLLKQLEQRIGKAKMIHLLNEMALEKTDTTSQFLHLLERETDKETRDYFYTLLNQ